MGIHILLVDDNDSVANVLRDILGMLGHSTARARSAEEGWRLFEEQGAELIITDNAMTYSCRCSVASLCARMSRPGIEIDRVCAPACSVNGVVSDATTCPRELHNVAPSANSPARMTFTSVSITSAPPSICVRVFPANAAVLGEIAKMSSRSRA